MHAIRAYRIIKPAFAISLAFLAFLPAYAARTIDSALPHPDVEYRRLEAASPSGTTTVHMVLVDLDAVREGRLTVEPALGGDLMGHTSSPESIGRRTGAIACINGPYFATAGNRTYPLGFTVINGRLAQLGNPTRPIVTLSPEGEFHVEVAHPQAFVTSDEYFEPVWLWGINAPAGSDAVTAYDRNWGTTVGVQGGTAVVVAPEEPESGEHVIVVGIGADSGATWDGTVRSVGSSGSVEIPEDGYVLVFRGRQESATDRFQPGRRAAIYTYELPDGWETMRWIATLGPWFVHEGRPRDYSGETPYGSAATTRAPRSAIGITWNDEMFFAVTSGAPLTADEAAEVLIECNVREAVMCDSGSSAGLWVEGVGSRGGSRAIPLALIVKEAMEEPDGVPGLRVWTERLYRH